MTIRPAVIRVAPTCPHCGNVLTPGGVAMVCAAGGKGGTRTLPGYCADRQCARDRDDAAIAHAIAAGVINP